jgi:putative transcriptional regulator
MFDRILKVLVAIALFAGGPWGSANIGDSPPSAREEAATGKFLVATKAMGDPRFKESVILLLNHGRDGSFGLIVNRPTSFSLSEILTTPFSPIIARTLYVGGPVQPIVLSMLIHSEQPLTDAVPLIANTYYVVGTNRVVAVATNFELVADSARIYAGYAGWASGQLNAEIARGSWLVTAGDADTVFSAAPERVWEMLTKKLSGTWL